MLLWGELLLQGLKKAVCDYLITQMIDMDVIQKNLTCKLPVFRIERVSEIVRDDTLSSQCEMNIGQDRVSAQITFVPSFGFSPQFLDDLIFIRTFPCKCVQAWL